MTWHHSDLSEYKITPESAPEGTAVLAVGWLDREHDFPTGDVPQEFIDTLAELCASYGYVRMRGWEACELDHPDGVVHPIIIEINGKETRLGNAEIRVATEDGTILAAPNLVYHYVTAHHYRPPEEFIQAVLNRRMAPQAILTISGLRMGEWDMREELQAIDEARRRANYRPS